MKFKQWFTKFTVLAVVVGFFSLNSKPAAASTYSVTIPCAQAQSAVNFLLALDAEVDEELAEGSISPTVAAFYDQYVDNAIAYIKAHTASTCSLGSE